MCFERRTWAHLTGVRAGSASLLEEIAREESDGSTTWERGEYPTPSATRYGSSQNEGEVPHDRPSRGTPSLDSWAAKLWTTPIASEQNRSGKNAQGGTMLSHQATKQWAAKRWPTPTSFSKASEGVNRPGNNRSSNKTLGIVANWPTPTAGDSTGDSAGRRGRTTPKDGEPGPLRAVLSPSFVETLQGFPVGWTDCAVSATPSSPIKRP
jgi:hypothetical protein